MTREERKRAKRRDVFRTLGYLTACFLLWLLAYYGAEAIMPM